MEFLQPAAWAEALQIKAAHPQAVPIQGGTDVMVELNFGSPSVQEKPPGSRRSR